MFLNVYARRYAFLRRLHLPPSLNTNTRSDSKLRKQWKVTESVVQQTQIFEFLRTLSITVCADFEQDNAAG